MCAEGSREHSWWRPSRAVGLDQDLPGQRSLDSAAGAGHGAAPSLLIRNQTFRHQDLARQEPDVRIGSLYMRAGPDQSAHDDDQGDSCASRITDASSPWP